MKHYYDLHLYSQNEITSFVFMSSFTVHYKLHI